MVVRTRKNPRHATAANNTRSHTKMPSELLTLESLQSAFEKIENRTRDDIARGCTDDELCESIHAAWISQFHRELDHPTLVGLVRHYRATTTGPRVTRNAGRGRGRGRSQGRKGHKGHKGRKGQRGGMAPLGWTMGPGATTAPLRAPDFEGTTLPYIRSLDRFGDDSANSTATGASQSQRGGSVLSSFAEGVSLMSAPSNPLQNIIHAIQGGLPGPSASPVSGGFATTPVVYQTHVPPPISQVGSMTTVYKGY